MYIEKAKFKKVTYLWPKQGVWHHLCHCSPPCAIKRYIKSKYNRNYLLVYLASAGHHPNDVSGIIWACFCLCFPPRAFKRHIWSNYIVKHEGKKNWHTYASDAKLSSVVWWWMIVVAVQVVVIFLVDRYASNYIVYIMTSWEIPESQVLLFSSLCSLYKNKFYK